MGTVFNHVKAIWTDLDQSYASQNAHSTRRDYLNAITGYSTGNKLPLILSKLDEEVSVDETILEEVKMYTEILELVSDNLKELMESEIHTFASSIEQLINKERTRASSNEDLSFAYESSAVQVITPLQMISRHGSISACSNIVDGKVVTVQLPSMFNQEVLCFARRLSLLEFNNMYFTDPEMKASPYYNAASKISKTILAKEDCSVMIVPRKYFRKTVSGYNLYAETTIKLAIYTEIEGFPVGDYNGIKIALVSHNNELFA